MCVSVAESLDDFDIKQQLWGLLDARAKVLRLSPHSLVACSQVQRVPGERLRVETRKYEGACRVSVTQFRRSDSLSASS